MEICVPLTNVTLLGCLSFTSERERDVKRYTHYLPEGEETETACVCRAARCLLVTLPSYDQHCRYRFSASRRCYEAYARPLTRTPTLALSSPPGNHTWGLNAVRREAAAAQCMVSVAVLLAVVEKGT